MAGEQALMKVIDAAIKTGVKFLSVYAFSTGKLEKITKRSQI